MRLESHAAKVYAARTLKLPPADLLEQFAKIVGIAVPAITALKVSVTFAIDRSLGRKTAKAVKEIDAGLGRLRKLEGVELILQPLETEQYRLQVKEDIHVKLLILEKIRTLKHRRAIERNEEPKGFRRWLLLYRPEGIDGLLVQSLYYASAVIFILFTVLVPILLALTHDWVILGALVDVVLFGLMARYSRNISLRLKSVGNVVRTKSLEDPNSDIDWMRRGLLLLKKEDGLWGLRALYYLFLSEVVFFPIIVKNDPEFPSAISFAEFIAISLSSLLVAQLFRIDALSRRAKTRLPI